MPSGTRIKPAACVTNGRSAGFVLLRPSYPPQDLGSAEPPGAAKGCDDPTPSAREIIPNNVLESTAEAVRLYGGDVRRTIIAVGFTRCSVCFSMQPVQLYRVGLAWQSVPICWSSPRHAWSLEALPTKKQFALRTLVPVVWSFWDLPLLSSFFTFAPRCQSSRPLLPFDSFSCSYSHGEYSIDL